MVVVGVVGGPMAIFKEKWTILFLLNSILICSFHVIICRTLSHVGGSRKLETAKKPEVHVIQLYVRSARKLIARRTVVVVVVAVAVAAAVAVAVATVVVTATEHTISLE